MILKNFRVLSYQRRGDDFIWSCFNEKGDEYTSQEIFSSNEDARKDFDRWVEKMSENVDVTIEG